MGRSGDPYERHADRVADAVVAGRSAQGLLDEVRGSDGTGTVVQRDAAAEQGPMAAAQALRPTIEAKLAGAQRASLGLSARESEINVELGLAIAQGAEDRIEALEKEKRDVADRLSKAHDSVVALAADLDALGSAGTDAAAYNRILAQHRAETDTTATTTRDWHDGDLERKPTEDRLTEVDSEYSGGTATTTTREYSSALGADGFTERASEVTETLESDGATTKTATSDMTRLGIDGFTQETSEEASEAKDGRETSKGRTEVTKVGPGGASQSTTETEGKADGSSTATTDTAALERKDGQLTASKGHSETTKDADGNAATHSRSTKGGIVAGEDGVGAIGEHEQKIERQRASGPKLGAVVNASGKATANVTEVPGTDPLEYLVTVTINLGGKIGGSAGYDTEGKPKVGGELSVGGSGTYSHARRLSAEEAKAYSERIKNADEKELAMIANAGGAARGLAQMHDADAQAAMGEGEKVSFGAEVEVGAGLSAGYGPVGGQVGYTHTESNEFSVEKKDGKLVYDQKFGESDKGTLGVNANIGPVSGGMSWGESTKSASGYKFELDPADPNFKDKQARLAAARSPQDLADFARDYPDAVKGLTDMEGEASDRKATVGVGGVELGLSSGDRFEETVTKDENGNVIGREMEGAASRGASLKAGDLELSASREEAATVSVDEEGRATLDITQTDKETNLAKLAGSALPSWLTGEPEAEQSALERATRAKPKADTTDTRVEGTSLTTGDLERLMARAADETSWNKGMAPPPRLANAWNELQRQIKAANGDQAVAARAVAEFMRAGGGCDDLVVGAAEKGGGREGVRYEFPEGLGHLKGTFDAIVVADPRDQVETVVKDKGAPAGLEAIDALLGRLQSLYNLIRSASGFQNPSARGEMLAAIDTRRSALEGRARELRGGSANELSREEWLAKYNALLTTCIEFSYTEANAFAKIEATFEDDKPSMREMIENMRLTAEIKDLHGVWMPKYKEMGGIAQAQEIGRDTYWKYKPDAARLARAVSGNPGPSTEPSPETEDLRPREPVPQDKPRPVAPPPPQHVVQEEMKKLRAVEKQTASGMRGAVPAAEGRAVAAGTRLQQWIHHQHRASALEAHNRGRAKLEAARGWRAKLPQNASDEEWNSYGSVAKQDFDAAAACFQEGLTLYPPGKPPA